MRDYEDVFNVMAGNVSGFYVKEKKFSQVEEVFQQSEKKEDISLVFVLDFKVIKEDSMARRLTRTA